MASRSEKTDGWPTVLWIAWKVGETEHREPLCLIHRAYVFDHHPTSAHGLKRRGDRCSMCSAHPPRPADVRDPRDSSTSSGEPEAADPRGRGTRARRVSPTRHDPSYPPARGGGRRRSGE